MPIIEYGEKELAWLARRDKKLGAFIERTGFLERELEPDLFAALVSSIATQQISNAAAETVMKRFEHKFRLTPSALADATVEEIQSVGISFRKAAYIKGFCDAVNQGLDLEALQAKLVGEARGGFCFEQNALFAAVLERLGYAVTRLAARESCVEMSAWRALTMERWASSTSR